MKTQQEIVLELLQTNERVNSYDLTYKHSIKQAPTRVHELREKGYQIVSSQPLKNGSIDYFLVVDKPMIQEPVECQPKGNRVVRYWNNGQLETITL